MAILIDFEKVREDDAVVEYRFGYPDELDRTLVIRKDIREATPSDGRVDGMFAKVLRKISEYVESRSTWPQSGSYAA